MRKFLVLYVAVTAAMFFISMQLLAQNLVVVTDCNLNGWLKQPIGSSSLGFINGPSNPPLGKGSMKFNVPAGGIFWPGDFVRFRNGQYSGTPLSSLTELSYSTFVEARDTIADIHFLVILVDINGDGSAEHNLVFDPRYQNLSFVRGSMPNQGITKEHVWQNWNALHAGWFYGGTTDTDPDHNGPFFTIAEYLEQYPNATIRNDAAKGGPAIRLSAGGVVFKPNFFGCIDNFRIGINGSTTIYDFESGTADAGANKTVVYGYSSNCVTLNGSAVGGVAPYTYLWSGGATPNNAVTEVCPTTTTTYTLTVTDANGCIRTDDVTVFVNDVRCGNKMDKVKLCHNGEEICVAKEAVAAHLNHGDQLGSCSQFTNGITQKTIQRNQVRQENEFILSAYPNPFNNSTNLTYDLPADGRVTIKLYDISGREISTLINADKKAGQYKFDFHRGNLSAGTYYTRIHFVTRHNYFSTTQKLIVFSK